MEANAMRLGNYFNWRAGDSPDEGYTERWESSDYEELEKFPERFRSITISEEWLSKFGFEKPVLSYNLNISKNTFLQLAYCNDKGKGEYYAMITQDEDIISMPKRVFYVHELQNLYHALTGLELETK